MANARNIYGAPLKLCCANGGFTREGFCYTPELDFGNHSVCAIVSDAFLQFSLSRGNDLTTPRPELSFPGLKEGDRWCLCATRWLEACQHGVAPLVDTEATSIRALEVIPMPLLERFSLAKASL